MATNRGRGAGQGRGHAENQQAEDEYPINEIPYRGSLLTRNASHSSNRVYDNKTMLVTTKAGSMTFMCDDQIMPILDRFEVGLLARLGTIKIDRNLITATVERWRRETHSFHLPTGEITITLQDVLCLWGLPLDGLPVMGDVDQNWEDLVFRCFGRVDWHSFRRPPGHFHMCRDWLREPWQPQREGPNDRRKLKARLPDDATEEEIERYARAYMLDLFSSVMFSDQSGYIQTMWLQFMEDVHDPPKYSWGSAVLERLYRALCDGSHKNKEQMGGPLMLLQMWVWTRFPIGRPRERTLPGHLPYGAKWMGTEHDYQDEPHRSITLYRYRYETLHPDDVNWWPYDEDEENMALLAPICNLQEHQSWYFYKGPLICFWIVEWHAPERVARQFGFAQEVPPPMLPPASDRLHEVYHDKKSEHRDWERYHAKYLAMWANRETADFEQGFRSDHWPHYLAWFNREGMRTVYWRGETARDMYNPIPPQHGHHSSRTYSARGEVVQRTVIRNLQLAHEAWGVMIQNANNSMRQFARRVLRSCRGNIEDVEHGHVFTNFMNEHNITEDDLEPSLAESMPPQPEQYAWLDQLVGGEHASQMPEPPLFHPPYATLSQAGVWEAGQASQTAHFEVGSSSGAANPVDVDPNPTNLRRTTRSTRAPSAYTPSEFDAGRGRCSRRMQ